MVGIEEAFAAAFRAGEDFYLLPRDATGEVVAKFRLRSAIRVLGLAVLDGAHSHEGLYRCNCTTWAEGDRCREYRADRAKILALGKEAE